MNKLLIVLAVCVASNVANAGEYRLVNTDNSALSALCITAVESPETISKSARSIGMKAREITELRCNGKTLPVFLSKFHETDRSPAVSYAFNKNDSTEETELCYAAVKSEQEFEQVKDTYFDGEQNIEEEVLCNGMPLKTFARKYRNRVFTASTR